MAIRSSIVTETGQPNLLLNLNQAGQIKLTETTKTNIGGQIGIYLDDRLLTNPTVQSPITSGTVSVSASWKDIQEAQNIASMLRTGPLPLKIEIKSKQIE